MTAGRVIGSGFGTYRSVTTAGDLTGDGLPDLLALHPDGRLLLFPGAPDGGLRASTVFGSGWSSLGSIAAGPDLDGDGSPGDLVVRQADGHMRTYYADTAGRLSRYNFWGAGWGALDNISSGADWNGDGVADVLARYPGDDTLRLYAGTGRRDFDTPPVDAGAQVAGMDLMRVVGDVDADGLTDAVARRAGTGDLYFLRGRSGGGFVTGSAPIGRGWQVFDLLEAAGDLSNDGVPDIMARTTGGELRLYTLTRSRTFGWSIQLGLGWGVMRSVVGAGSVNTDYNGDVVALRASDGAVLLYRGSGPGTLNDFVVAVAGQSDLRRILGMGDFNGDNNNDLLAKDDRGRLWLYGGTGTGFSRYRQPVAVEGAVDDVEG